MACDLCAGLPAGSCVPDCADCAREPTEVMDEDAIRQRFWWLATQWLEEDQTARLWALAEDLFEIGRCQYHC